MPFRKETHRDQFKTFHPGIGVSEDDPIYLGVKSNLEHLQRGEALEDEKDPMELQLDDEDEDFDV
jgi:hypothetical protein